MAGLNKVMLIGHLGADPDMRFTGNGTPVASFRIAISQFFKGSDGENKENTEWVNVTAWQSLAERVTQYLKKGSKVYVEGRLQTRSYEDKSGNKQYRTEVVANNVLFLDRNGNGNGQSSKSSFHDDDDDLGF